MESSNICFTTQGDYACSWCGYLIPTKRINGEETLKEWCSSEVAGMFCSQSHAIAATYNINYRTKWAFEKVGA